MGGIAIIYFSVLVLLAVRLSSTLYNVESCRKYMSESIIRQVVQVEGRKNCIQSPPSLPPLNHSTPYKSGISKSTSISVPRSLSPRNFLPSSESGR